MNSLKALAISSCAAPLLAIFVVPGSSLAQEVPRITFSPMTQDEVDRFRDSLKNNIALVSHPPRQSERVDSHTSGVWSGSETDVQTNIEEVVLRFRPSTEEVLARSITTENESKALLEYVDLKLSYKHPQVTFIHSHPQDGREVSGFEAKVFRKDIPTRVRTIVGQRESTMYVGVPPFDNPAELWGLYICPRIFKYQPVGRTGTRVMSLAPSPYSLSEIKLTASASGRATFESSRGKVKAAVSLQLSSDMPESMDSNDISISAVAEPKVTYRPKFPFDFFRFAPQTDIQQGLNMVVELQNRAGKIRRQNFSHVLSVHKSNEPSPVSVMADGVRPASDAGDCYIVQVQKYSWKEFATGEVNF